MTLMAVAVLLGACAADPMPEDAAEVAELAAQCRIEDALAEADRLSTSTSRFVRQAAIDQRTVLLLDQGRTMEAQGAQAQIAQQSGAALEDVEARHSAALEALRARRAEVSGREDC